MKGFYITLTLFVIALLFSLYSPERKVIDKKRKPRELATYEERIMWFMKHYYESGMEYDILLVSMEGADLDNFHWYDDIIQIPRYKDELDE